MFGVIDFVIVNVKFRGKVIDDIVFIFFIIIFKFINQVVIVEFQLFIFYDSDVVMFFFLVRDEDYVLGEVIEILLGYDIKEESVFEGIIVV